MDAKEFFEQFLINIGNPKEKVVSSSLSHHKYDYDIVIKALTEYKQYTGEKTENVELKSFLEFIAKERDAFVAEFLTIPTTTNRRVMAENLLIAYDQMKERLLSSSQSDEGWIDASKELPEQDEWVLIYNSEGAILRGVLSKDGWFVHYTDGIHEEGALTIKKWYPLPSPPQAK